MAKDENIILLKSGKIVNILKKYNVSVVKTKKLHKLLVDEKGRRTTILSNRNAVISPILLERMLKDLNIEIADFINNM